MLHRGRCNVLIAAAIPTTTYSVAWLNVAFVAKLMVRLQQNKGNTRQLTKIMAT